MPPAYAPPPARSATPDRASCPRGTGANRARGRVVARGGGRAAEGSGARRVQQGAGGRVGRALACPDQAQPEGGSRERQGGEGGRGQFVGDGEGGQQRHAEALP